MTWFFTKTKWGVVYNDFKQFFDCMNKIWHNIEYWNLTPQEKIALSLPWHYYKNKYELILTLSSFTSKFFMPMILWPQTTTYILHQVHLKNNFERCSKI
jgi:hypothetical protein